MECSETCYPLFTSTSCKSNTNSLSIDRRVRVTAFSQKQFEKTNKEMIVVGVTEGSSGKRLKRRYPVGASFWDDGNMQREAAAKQCALDLATVRWVVETFLI